MSGSSTNMYLAENYRNKLNAGTKSIIDVLRQVKELIKVTKKKNTNLVGHIIRHNNIVVNILKATLLGRK